MEKKFTTSGNSAALVIDRPLLEAAGLTVKDVVDVRAVGEEIIISRPPDPERAAKFKAVLERMNNRYANVFTRLAK